MQPEKSIAILPFVNMSAEPENEYFSDGLTEEIINGLTRVEGLKVTARTSSFAFKNKNEDIRIIGRQLNVSTILEGSVRVYKDQVRITAQLINVANGFHYWSETFDRQLKDIFQLQDEISLLIADKLRENMGHLEIGDRLVDTHDIPVEVYQKYLQGRFYVQRLNLPNVKKGLALLAEVIELAPDYPHAYITSHFGYIMLGTLGLMPVAEAFEKGGRFLFRAIELNPDLPECHYQLAGIAFWQQWDFPQAYQHISQAIRLRPGYADAYQSLAMVLAAEGRFDAALENINKALQLDPFSVIHHHSKGIVYYLREEYDEAIVSLKKSIELEPDFLFSHIFWGASLYMKGHIEEGIERFHQLPPAGSADLSNLAGLSLGYALKGDAEKTDPNIRIIRENLHTDMMGRSMLFLILIQAALGRHEEALTLIGEGIKHKLPMMVFLRAEPFLKSLRPYPEFQNLMGQIFADSENIDPGIPKTKYQKSPLKTEDAERYHHLLEQCMAEQQPYLNPKLSLRQLADVLDIHPNYLSQVLNERTGQNFAEYINRYRLEAFKTKTRDPANHHLTILGLALECGFNSKTTFNTFFKKAMHMTPREYWKQVVG